MAGQYFIQVNFFIFALVVRTSHLCAMNGPSPDEGADALARPSGYTNPKPDLEEEDPFAFCDRLKAPLDDLEREQLRLLAALIPHASEEESKNEEQ